MNRPTSSTFETIYDIKAAKTHPLDPYSDYGMASSISDLDSLDLVTSLEIKNQQSHPATGPPKLNSPNRESKCENDELCGTTAPISQRRHRKNFLKNSTTQNPTVSPFESESTENSFDSSAGSDLINQNLRRNSQEDYDIDCGSSELEPVVQPTTSVNSELVKDKPDFPLENNLVTPVVQPSTIGESLRRMSESEEISTECDSVEDLIAMTTSRPSPLKRTRVVTPPPIQFITSITLAPVERMSDAATVSTTNTMRKMSESEEIQTDCESETSDNTKIDRPATMSTSSSIALYSTPTEEAIAPTPKTLTMNELSRRMSVSDVDCKSVHLSMHKTGESTMMPVRDSMLRMSESNENSADFESHADHTEVTVTTSAPSIRPDSMRRMSHSDKATTEMADHRTNPKDPLDYPTEYVTECDTEAPLPLEDSAPDSHSPPKTMEISNEDSLLCCPDSVCALLHPNVPNCDGGRIVTSKLVRKIDELRDMFYLYETQVLITKMVGDSDYIKKRMSYERDLVSLWNETLSITPIHIINGCTDDSRRKNVKQIISSIYCFLRYTDSLLNDTFLEIILNVVKRIETNFPGNKVLRYHKLRRIILQSMPKVLNQSDQVARLAHYMQHNRNYENERIFLLNFLLDIQDRFEANMKNYFNINQLNAKITDSSKSLQENGLGIKMHRTLN